MFVRRCECLRVMRIKRQENAGHGNDRAREDSQALLDAALAEGRVCGASCRTVCNVCGRLDCRCMCQAVCPDAPRQLSSDPEAYPIEAGIAGLVLALKRLGIYQPCWSCEGHLGHDGTLWKRPRVWFYCESVIHLRLLADVLQSPDLKRQLAGVWQVVTLPWVDGVADTAFSLEPDTTVDDLVALQRDTTLIAETLADRVFAHAAQFAAS